MDDDIDKFARYFMRGISSGDQLTVYIARVLAPLVNHEMKYRGELVGQKTNYQKHKKDVRSSSDFCQGCSELSSWAPDLCPECLAVNADINE